MTDKAAVRAEALRLRRLFETAGADVVDPAILQPADTLLDLYGEDIRARAYVTHDPLLGDFMLRPDFTVPVVQRHLERGAASARYTYSGEIFRKQETDPDRQSEYVQVGFELFTDEDPAAADAEVFSLIAEALGGSGLRPVTGDIGFLIMALQGLSLSPERKAALMRHLWRPGRFRDLLERFSGRASPGKDRKALLQRLADGEDPLDDIGPHVGLRNTAEIRARLDRIAADALEPPIGEAEGDVLDHILSLKGSCEEALSALEDMAVDLPVLQPAVERFERRLDALSGRGADVSGLGFEGSFGRTTLEYYDGFVFGFVVPDRPDLPAISTGGRYDALTRVMGKGRTAPAVGGVIRPDLLLGLRGEGLA